MAEPLLRLADVDAGYDGAPVVRGFNLEVSPGEVIALLGPNGAGKTTVLRAVSGLVRPMKGTLEVLGDETGGASPSRIARRGVAHVAEGRSIFFGLTVGEHFRLHRHVDKADADMVFDYFPALRKLSDRRAGLLSGGEQQMLALAFAFSRRPRLLLVDELSLGLAPVIVEQLLPVVRRYATESGAGVVCVEQHVELVLDVADRATVLSHGETVLTAEASELRHNHHLLVSSYMGDSDPGRSS